LKEDPRLG